MKRRRRWFSLLTLFPLLAACAMLREGNPQTTPNPHDWPCGYVDADWCPGGVEGHRTCCRYHGTCLDDGDCQFNIPSDPADPTMMRRGQRYARVSEDTSR